MPIKAFIPLFLALTTLPVLGIEPHSLFRFQRLLRQYDYPDYRVNDRDIFTDFDYSAHSQEIKQRYSTISNDGANWQNYTSNFSDTTGFTGRWLRSSSLKQSDQKLWLSLNGVIDNNSEYIDNSLTGYNYTQSDEKWYASGSIGYSGAFRRYSRISFLSKLLFFELYNHVDITGTYALERSYIHDIDRYEDSTSLHTSRLRYAGGDIDLLPAIGYGKKLPVAPVYKAFEIERKLKKAGAIRSNLSDATLMKLAKLCGSIESFRINHDRPDKSVMKQLEKIISADSTVDTVQLRAFALFKAHETFSERMPMLFKGFEVKLNLDFRFRYFYNDIDSGFSGGVYYRSQSFMADLDLMDPLKLNWTLPVASRLFIEFGIGPGYYSWKDRFDYDGTIGAYFFITNMIVAHASISKIPLFFAIPYDTPHSFDLETDFFLEDHISLILNCFKHIKKDRYDTFRRGVDEGVSLRVNYDF